MAQRGRLEKRRLLQSQGSPLVPATLVSLLESANFIWRSANIVNNEVGEGEQSELQLAIHKSIHRPTQPLWS